MRAARTIALAASAVLGAGACQIVTHIERKELATDESDAAVSDGGAVDDASPEVDGASRGGDDAGGTGDAAPADCPKGLKGPALVKVPDGRGGITCVDATEVTIGQYAEFLAATSGGTATSGLQPPECSWNATFKPYAQCLDPTYWPGPYICTGADCADKPQVCVHWCDAYAYCKWAGKRLCGTIGGGASPVGSYDDPKTSQWMNACSSGGKYLFTYGNTYKDAGACVGAAPPGDAGGQPGCQSPDSAYAGVFDMNGDVWEWEDSCGGTSGVGDKCHLRGGSFVDPSARCDDARVDDRAANNQPDYGIRCCWP